MPINFDLNKIKVNNNDKVNYKYVNYFKKYIGAPTAFFKLKNLKGSFALQLLIPWFKK